MSGPFFRKLFVCGSFSWRESFEEFSLWNDMQQDVGDRSSLHYTMGLWTGVKGGAGKKKERNNGSFKWLSPSLRAISVKLWSWKKKHSKINSPCNLQTQRRQSVASGSQCRREIQSNFRFVSSHTHIHTGAETHTPPPEIHTHKQAQIQTHSHLDTNVYLHFHTHTHTHTPSVEQRLVRRACCQGIIKT